MSLVPDPLKRRIGAIYVFLLALNGAGWAWALAAFRHQPLFLGTAFLAYVLGLRHAVDADHIAAIDNVTRKLMQQGKRPAGVGLFFSLGHSTIVIALTVAIALTSLALKGRLARLADIGAALGTGISAAFLLIIALANTFVLVSVYRTFQRVRQGGAFEEEDLSLLLAKRGFISRVFRSLFGLIDHSWQMYLVGFLFGLGFDTATEVALLGLSAKGAVSGLPIWTILVFPVLFTAGMALVDTTDGVVMLGAYHWAFVNPMRKLYYNLTITFVSIVVAVLIGGIETLGLVGDWLQLRGPLWTGIQGLNNNFTALGFVIVGTFVLSWAASAVFYRLNGYHLAPADGSRAR